MNNKGFSMVELLAIITILGLIMGIAIPGYQQYVTKTRNEAYKNLMTTARTAAQNRFVQEGLEFDPGKMCKSYTIVEDLYEKGFMDKPSDPASTATNCDGTVYIKEDNTAGLLMENYLIKVDLKCSVYEGSDCKDTGGADCNTTFGTCS